MRRRYHTEVTIGSGTIEGVEEWTREEDPAPPVSKSVLESNSPAGQCTRSECGSITAWRVLLSSPSVNGFGMIALKPSFWKS